MLIAEVTPIYSYRRQNLSFCVKWGRSIVKIFIMHFYDSDRTKTVDCKAWLKFDTSANL